MGSHLTPRSTLTLSSSTSWIVNGTLTCSWEPWTELRLGAWCMDGCLHNGSPTLTWLDHWDLSKGPVTGNLDYSAAWGRMHGLNLSLLDLIHGLVPGDLSRLDTWTWLGLFVRSRKTTYAQSMEVLLDLGDLSLACIVAKLHRYMHENNLVQG